MYFKTKINFPKTHFGSLVKHITSFWLLFTAAFGVKHPGAMHLFKKQKQKKTLGNQCNLFIHMYS